MSTATHSTQMSPAGQAGNQPASPSSHELNERAERRAVLALFAGIVVLASIGIAISAIAGSVMGHHRGMLASGGAVAAASTPRHISLAVVPGSKSGPKGELFDAFSKTNFNVRVDQPVQLTIDNKDDVVHSISSGEAGVNIVAMPGVHTYTLIVRRAGRFKWICAYPCDPYSMSHTGYMQGYITAT